MLHAVDAMVIFQELVVAALKVAVMMDREELMGLPKVDQAMEVALDCSIWVPLLA